MSRRASWVFSCGRVTHVVSWIPLHRPLEIWDSKGLHERDSLNIIPLGLPLKGISAAVKTTTHRHITGMMDVGPAINGYLRQGVETYSGAALEEQWGRLALRAFRAGYEIHKAELLPTSYQRADLKKSLSFMDMQDNLMSIPYTAYKVTLLMSWMISVNTYTTFTISTDGSDESIVLTPKSSDTLSETIVLGEMLRHKSVCDCSMHFFTTQIKFRVLLTKDLSIAGLNTGSWGSVTDLRIQKTPMEGPIISYIITNESGLTWLMLTLLWAPQPPLQVSSTPRLDATDAVSVEGPKTPSDIITCVKVIHDAAEQYAYYTANQTKPFNEVASAFPMTHLEIGLNSLPSNSSEYINKKYTV